MKRRKSSATIDDILSPLSDVLDRLNRRREVVAAELAQLDDHIARIGGHGRRGRKAAIVATDGAPVARRKGKRTRRSREELETQAAEIADFIKSAGKEGATGKEIKTKFGNLLPSVNAWLKLYNRGAKIKTTGQKSKMRYMA